MATTCPACGSHDVEPMGRVGPVPVLCGSLWDSREEALATPMASLDIAVCGTCAHVWNTTFDAALVEYDAKYDNALEFSPTFRRYSSGLVGHLVESFDLQGKRIAEIGSGKGEFLRQLCAAGGNKGVGYDPTYEGPDHDGDVDFVREFFTPDTSPGDVDFVCCRHVLEHVARPVDFLRDVRAAVDDEPVPMYFEVPNAAFNFSESGPWDLIYPHVGYFNEASLTATMTRAGFRVLRLVPSFNSQFLAAEVVPDKILETAEPVVPPAGGALTSIFRRRARRQLEQAQVWRGRLSQLTRAGSVALWGAGSKGVTFLSLVDPQRTVGTVVDVNSRKWGLFLAGTGHQVANTDAVGERGVTAVLVTNPVYEAEIRRSLAEAGCKAEVVAV